MWGAPWGGWRTATTEGGALPPCGQEEGLRFWGHRLESRPAAGRPGTRQEGKERLQINYCFDYCFCLRCFREKWRGFRNTIKKSTPLCPSSAVSAASTAPSWRSSRGTWPSLRGASAPGPTLGPVGTTQSSSCHRRIVSIFTSDSDIKYSTYFSSIMVPISLCLLIKSMNVLWIWKNNSTVLADFTLNNIKALKHF